MKKVLIILGPTATGKTDLALFLAKNFNGEIISCDSRQVYVGLDIGAGKLSGGRWKVENGRWKKGKGFWQIDGVKIWMYDMIKPNKQYTVVDFVKDAGKVIGETTERGKLPIIAGGTGFYLKALLEGLPTLAVPPDLKLRRKLAELSLEELQKKLQKLFPKRWENMNFSDRQNPRRLIRAIEIVILNPKGEGSSMVVEDSSLITQNDILKIGLTIPRQVLYQRIDERVIDRINLGMIEEVKKLSKNGLSLKRMKQLGLEYGVLADYLSGEIRETRGDQGLIKIMQYKIHGYVRRQLTWFKKEKDVLWFDITNEKYPENVEKRVSKWYHQDDDSKNRHLS